MFNKSNHRYKRLYTFYAQMFILICNNVSQNISVTL